MIRTTLPAFLVTCLLAAGPSFTHADNGLTEHKFLWNEGNARMARAQTGEDFIAAAETYRKLIQAGVQNGPVFYNLGLALMLGERYDEALHAFYRCERYSGSNEDIRQNMRLCLSLREEKVSTGLPWYRFLLFWHFGLPGALRLTIAATAFTVCWLAILMRYIGPRQAAEALLAVSLAVLVLFASSAATTLHQEHRDMLFTPVSDFEDQAIVEPTE